MDADRLLATSHAVRPLVSSWLGAELLADDVPLVEGTLDVDGASPVPERLTLSVPASHAGRSWVPRGEQDPLAHWGQRLQVAYAVGRSTGEVACSLGGFAVQSWAHDDVAGLVRVECAGLAQTLADASFTVPFASAPAATFVSTIKALLVNADLAVDFVGLTDRAVPVSAPWQQDRLGALLELAGAWPARMRIDDTGTLVFSAPLPASPGIPVLTFRDGQDSTTQTVTIFGEVFGASFDSTTQTLGSAPIFGTLVSAPEEGSRDGVFNGVVVYGADTDSADSPPVQAAAYDRVATSPTRWGGPFGRKPLPGGWTSPRVTTQAQAEAAAVAKLADLLRPTRLRVVTCVPDPRVELDDVAAVTRAGLTETGWVVGYSLPLTAAQGAMTVRVGVPG